MIGNYLLLAGCAIAILIALFALGFGLLSMWQEEAWGIVLFLGVVLLAVVLLIVGAVLRTGGI